MVQKEVRKKTRIYGTIAILSAIVLVALIYVYGSTPGVFTPETLPETSPMKTFNSYEELKSFLTANTQDGSTYYGGGPLDSQFFGSSRETLNGAVPAAIGEGDYSSSSYSTTNIQVEGVDEADIVKTDGNYIYAATDNNYYSASQNNVYIVKADPRDPRIIAKIDLGNNTYVAGLFLSEDSSKLVVIGSQYQLYAYEEIARPQDIMIYPYYSSVNTFLRVYDVSEKASPVLARNLTLSGSYFNSRMIGDYVYTVVSQPTYFINEDVVLPQVYENAGASEIAPSRIYYADVVDNYFTFTTFIGLNLMDDEQEPTNMTVLMGGASTMYVSLNNIYVTYPRWSEQGQYTSIYRVRVTGSDLSFEAKGNVLGYVLNQYSMDEYDGYFRLATTSQINQTQQNNIYVLDANLNVTGKLENLAEDERIYSARFMGDKCYLVTFRQVDPFFVLDMSDPAEPKIAGELKIPGYSSYLHPFDENHVMGLGKENSTVKLSLFDVTNVYAPTEIAKYVVEADYADSQALYDPHAFLFDKDKQLLALPISLTQYGVVDPSGRDEIYSWATTAGFWQGAFVFKVTTSGFTLRGGITHQENTTEIQYYYGYNNMQVQRALYIGNTLYTLSNAKVKLNNLDTLALIAVVNLN
ncbi:MAG: beta-propeller domain-containing protein [Candidatus Bathyarchaeia archaeon]|nr:beta-propeller domain-containing protein [Candidatus Bathyarchaeia archaeon]